MDFEFDPLKFSAKNPQNISNSSDSALKYPGLAGPALTGTC